MMRRRQDDVLKAAADDSHVKGYGKNFKPLIEAGSWTICGFHYGKAKCGCCGRPIYHVLHLKNESHDVSSSFPEQVEVGIVCGPKVFMESCVGFYSDPSREWERQHKAWKDYINYVVICVKHEKLWALVPEELRSAIDHFLAEGYKAQEHSGGWWMVKDAKKRFLKCQKNPDVVPDPRVLWAASRSLVYTARRLSLVPMHWELKCDYETGAFSLTKDAPLPATYA